jgi:hypothetical protein
LYLGPQAAEDFLSLVLPDADMQPIAKGLDILDILILMRDMTEEI